jgi:hypothetical protein
MACGPIAVRRHRADLDTTAAFIEPAKSSRAGSHKQRLTRSLGRCNALPVKWGAMGGDDVSSAQAVWARVGVVARRARQRHRDPVAGVAVSAVHGAADL